MTMTLDEKKAFLRKMGYNPRALDPEPHLTKKREKEKVLGADGLPKNHVDKKELLSVYRIFHKDQKTVGKPQQSLEDFMKENASDG